MPAGFEGEKGVAKRPPRNVLIIISLFLRGFVVQTELKKARPIRNRIGRKAVKYSCKSKYFFGQIPPPRPILL